MKTKDRWETAMVSVSDEIIRIKSVAKLSTWNPSIKKIR
jgi:hypothetical protein